MLRREPRGPLPPVTGKRRWRILLLLVGNGFGQAGAAVVAALLVERAVTQLTTGAGRPAWDVVAVSAGGLLSAAGASAWLRGRERVDAERLGQSYTHELRLRLFSHLTATSPRALAQRSTGGTVMRFVGDLNGIRRWVSRGLARLLVAGTTAIATLTVLAVLAPELAAAVAVVLVVGAIATVRRGSELRAVTRAARRRRSRLAANVTEKSRTVGVIHAFDTVGRERKRIRRQSTQLKRAMVQRARVSGQMQAIAEGTASACTAAVVVTGLATGATPGRVAGAMAIVGLLVPGLRDLGRVQEYHHTYRVAVEAVQRFLARPADLPTAPRGAPALTDGPGELALEDVTVLGGIEHVTATVPAGATVAIVGPNGAGKSTLLGVVARLIAPDAGRVTLDGQDLAEVKIADVRAALGLASPDLPLLRGTVERNLRERSPDASELDLWRVLSRCGMRRVLDELPDGLATRIGEDGAGLSAGQRQRVALARALLGDPRVLLLDEADANLDRTAARVVDSILAGHDGTALVVTHLLDRVRAADLVWHLDDGRLVEVGRPGVVLAGDGPTARLFRAGWEVAP